MSEEYKKLVEILDDQGVLQSDHPWAEPIIKFVKANKNRKARTQPASTGGEAVAWQVRSMTDRPGSNWTKWRECSDTERAWFSVDAGKFNAHGIMRELRALYTRPQPAPARVVVDREWTEFLSELHSHLDNIAEFDPSYPGDTMPRNTSAELLVALRALLNQAGGE